LTTKKVAQSKRRAQRKRRSARKLKTKRKPFGGYNISFVGCTETLEQVFGKKGVTPSEMTKLLWKYIKKHKIAGFD